MVRLHLLTLRTSLSEAEVIHVFFFIAPPLNLMGLGTAFLAGSRISSTLKVKEIKAQHQLHPK